MTRKALASNQDVRKQIPLRERCMLEGDPYSTGNQIENATLADGNSVCTLSLPSLGRALWVESITVSATKLAAVQVQIGTSVQSNLQQNIRAVVGPNAAVTVPLQQLVRPQHILAGTIAFGGVTVRKALDTTTGAYVYAWAHGWQIYDDLNWGADKVILEIGDSINNDTTGITNKVNSSLWKLRGYFKAKGQNVRVINRSMSGSSSTDHETRRKLGTYDLPQVDLISYQLGTNPDASASVSGTNLTAMIAHKQKFYPDAQMVVWGSTPLADNTNESALAAVRAAQLAAVTAANDPKVRYHSLAAAFDRTVTGNYAGDGIHPSETGHAAVAADQAAYLDAQSLTI